MSKFTPALQKKFAEISGGDITPAGYAQWVKETATARCADMDSSLSDEEKLATFYGLVEETKQNITEETKMEPTVVIGSQPSNVIINQEAFSAALAEMRHTSDNTSITGLFMDMPPVDSYVKAGTKGLIKAIKDSNENPIVKAVKDKQAKGYVIVEEDAQGPTNSQANYDQLQKAFSEATPVAVALPKFNPNLVGFQLKTNQPDISTSTILNKEQLINFLATRAGGIIKPADDTKLGVMIRQVTVTKKRKNPVTNVAEEYKVEQTKLCLSNKKAACEAIKPVAIKQATSEQGKINLRSELCVTMKKAGYTDDKGKQHADSYTKVRVLVSVEVPKFAVKPEYESIVPSKKSYGFSESDGDKAKAAVRARLLELGAKKENPMSVFSDADLAAIEKLTAIGSPVAPKGVI